MPGTSAEQLSQEPPPAQESPGRPRDKRVEEGKSSAAVVAEIRAGLPAPLERRFGALPQEAQGAFAQAKESTARLFRGERDPAAHVDGARKRAEAQDGLYGAADAQLQELTKAGVDARYKAERAGQEAEKEVDFGRKAREELAGKDWGPLGGEAAKKQTLEALDGAARAKIIELSKKEKEHKAQAEKVQGEIAKTIQAQEKLRASRQEAHGRLDKAAIEAVNSNAEQTRKLEAMIENCDGQSRENKSVIGELDRALQDLQAQRDEYNGTAAEQIFSGLIKDAETRKAALVQKDGEIAKARVALMAERKKVETASGNLVKDLSAKKVEELLDDPEHKWIVGNLSVKQLMSLEQSTLQGLLADRAYQETLIVKLDQAGKLQGLVEQGIIDEVTARRFSKKKEEAAAPVAAEDLRKREMKTGFSERMTMHPKKGVDGNGEMTLKFDDGAEFIISHDKLIERYPDGRVAATHLDSISDAEFEQFMFMEPQELRDKGYPVGEAVLSRMERILADRGAEKKPAEGPVMDTAGNWKDKLEANDAELDLPDDLADVELSDVEVASLVYDQQMAKAAGKNELQKGLATRVVELVRELFGAERGGKIAAELENQPRSKVEDSVRNWNKAHPELKIRQIPPQLRGRELSAASLKLELMKMVKSETTIDAAELKGDVAEFLKHEEEQAAATTPPAAAAA